MARLLTKLICLFDSIEGFPRLYSYQEMDDTAEFIIEVRKLLLVIFCDIICLNLGIGT